MRSIPTLLSVVSLLALTGSTAFAAPPSHPISPDHPWALELEDRLSKPIVEQWYGEEVAEAWRDIEPHWDGELLLTRDSFDEQMLSALGVPPVPAMNYEPAPGVVYVAMDGVTLRPTCGNGDSAHSALNCSPLVDSEVTFPAFGAQAASEFEQIRNYYEPFDLVMTSARPPDWLPYTMTIIGGSAQLAGHGGGTCGVANVACDGLKRNHVSLNFPQSCNGMAETVGQETAHNWGLEHTDNPNDMLYPFNNGGSKSFVDDCMAISHATGSGTTQCGYIHELYCGEEQQNSFAEMMGVFGPASPDTTAPEITSIYPGDGAELGTEDAFTITASIEEDSRMVAVKWTWLEGLPPDTESYTRCTNNVCDTDFNPGVSFVAADVAWDFLNLNGPPPGTYSFQVEALDAYGNYTSAITTFTVVEGEGAEGGNSTADGGVDESGGDDMPPGGTGGTGNDDDGPATGPGVSGEDDGGGGSSGCRIEGESPRFGGFGGGAMLSLGLLLFARRRRA